MADNNKTKSSRDLDYGVGSNVVKNGRYLMGVDITDYGLDVFNTQLFLVQEIYDEDEKTNVKVSSNIGEFTFYHDEVKLYKADKIYSWESPS
jgi:hypothetical protein